MSVTQTKIINQAPGGATRLAMPECPGAMAPGSLRTSEPGTVTAARPGPSGCVATGSPRVSIGMPVRNGQKYIGEAIDSILAQTFTDWELIVCDNASTDATEQIVRQYAQRDTRIRYHRNERDIGPAGNHNIGFQLARGEYFRWHAHDDMIAPEYLAKCVAALDADPTVVSVHTQTQIVNDRRELLEEYNFRISTDAATATRRFAQLVLVKHRRHRAVEIFGLMRSAALRETPLQGCYARGDSVMLVRMALRGRFVEVPGRDFLSRSHPSQSMQQLPSRFKDASGRRLISRCLGTGPLPPPEWWDSSLKGKITFPEWRLMREYWGTLRDTNLTTTDRLKCRLVMAWWAVSNVHKLARDVIVAAEHTMWSAMDAIRPNPSGPLAESRGAGDPSGAGSSGARPA